MSGRSIRQYLSILTLIFIAAFLAGMLAPSSTRLQMTDAFQVVADSYRGIAGKTLFFSLLFNYYTIQRKRGQGICPNLLKNLVELIGIEPTAS